MDVVWQDSSLQTKIMQGIGSANWRSYNDSRCDAGFNKESQPTLLR